jgi:hypothetical protein
MPKDQKKASGDALGDRMKAYEAQECSRRFLPMLPVYARIDGRNFSGFTKGMDRHYDTRMSAAMVETVKGLVEKTHAKMGYTQSLFRLTPVPFEWVGRLLAGLAKVGRFARLTTAVERV